MNFFAHIQRILLRKRLVSGKQQKKEYHIEGVRVLGAVKKTLWKKAEKEEVEKASSLYMQAIDKMQSGSSQKEDLFSLFSSLFVQLDALSSRVPAECAQSIASVRKEAEPLLMQHMYAHVESASAQEGAVQSSSFVSALSLASSTSQALLKIRYLAQRAQKIQKAIPTEAEVFLEVLENECHKYCVLFGVASVLQESPLTIEGFIFSVFRGSPWNSKSQNKKIRECIEKRASGDAARILRRYT
ncbi:uncharacterized protein NEMAJ01_1295 [Nematocida major]|uniref:uncharacterized protein n=1 Tax=Nematocida major TaxID=1912982 RepID=UPI0020075703|nr:uncharacterized protein NEMAJ01_1295 [Nematocida major]KAH9386399.1 hypothetical protein NEMAJ01_1295 [Nematocida major]